MSQQTHDTTAGAASQRWQQVISLSRCSLHLFSFTAATSFKKQQPKPYALTSNQNKFWLDRPQVMWLCHSSAFSASLVSWGFYIVLYRVSLPPAMRKQCSVEILRGQTAFDSVCLVFGYPELHWITVNRYQCRCPQYICGHLQFLVMILIFEIALLLVKIPNRIIYICRRFVERRCGYLKCSNRLGRIQWQISAIYIP